MRELEVGVLLVSFDFGGVIDSRSDRRSEFMLLPRFSVFVAGVNITFFNAVVGARNFVVGVLIDDVDVVVGLLRVRKPLVVFFCLEDNFVVVVLEAFSLSREDPCFGFSTLLLVVPLRALRFCAVPEVRLDKLLEDNGFVVELLRALDAVPLA